MILAIALLATAQLSLSEYRQPLVPPEPLPLGGYTERGDAVFEPGGEDLFAQIAILRQGHRKVALVAFEGLTVPESLFREVQQRLPGINVMLVATHTHSAPDTQMLNDRMTFRIPGIASYKRRQLEWYALRIAGGISIADQSRYRPVNSLTCQISLTDLARSRRSGTQVSNQLTRIFADDKPLLTIFGAHGTIYGADRMQTGGDWPGSFMRQVGGLVWPGAIGNASPNVEAGTPESQIKRMVAGLSSAEPAVGLDKQIEFIREPIKLPPATPHPDFAATNNVTPELAQIAVSRFAPDQASLTALRIGNVVLLGVPGEPSGDLEKQIIEVGRKYHLRVAVVSHCNGWMGYLLSPEDYRRGGYEATLMFYGPESGTRVVEAAIRAIRGLARYSM